MATTMEAPVGAEKQTKKRNLALGGGGVALAVLAALGVSMSTSSSATGGTGGGATGGTGGGATVNLAQPGQALVAPQWVHDVDRSLGSLHTEVDGIQESVDKVMTKLDKLEDTMDKIVDTLIARESIR